MRKVLKQKIFVIVCTLSMLLVPFRTVNAAGASGCMAATYYLTVNGHTIIFDFNQGSEEDELYITSPTAGDWISNNRPNVHVTFYSSKYGYYETDVFYTGKGSPYGSAGATGIWMRQAASYWDRESSGGSKHAMESAWLHNGSTGTGANGFVPVSAAIDGLPAAHTCNSNGYVPPTCEQAGYFYCTGCGNRVGDLIPALGHIKASAPYMAIPATCTDESTEQYRCVRYGTGGCTKEYENEHSTPPLGHQYDAGVVETEATVYNKGVLVKTCHRVLNDGRECGSQVREDIEQKHFSIYLRDMPVTAIYLGENPVYEVMRGDISFVKE